MEQMFVEIQKLVPLNLWMRISYGEDRRNGGICQDTIANLDSANAVLAVSRPICFISLVKARAKQSSIDLTSRALSPQRRAMQK